MFRLRTVPTLRTIRSRLSTPFRELTITHPRLSKDSNPPPPSEPPSTGSINRSESSIYSSEQTRSATHQEVVELNSETAFNPSLTNPEGAKRRAGEEEKAQKTGQSEATNPLEYSPATPEVSQVTKDDRPQHGGRDRESASGGSKKA